MENVVTMLDIVEGKDYDYELELQEDAIGEKYLDIYTKEHRNRMSIQQVKKFRDTLTDFLVNWELG